MNLETLHGKKYQTSHPLLEEDSDGSTYIDANGAIRNGDMVTFDVVTPDANYYRVEANCQTDQFRSTRQGYFESQTRVNYSNIVNPWSTATQSYHQALLTFVCNEDFTDIVISTQCITAVDHVIRSLVDGRRISVQAGSFRHLADDYETYPTDRPLRFYFLLDGEQWEDISDIYSSPQLIEIGEEFIDGCSFVGLVEFIPVRASESRAFGFISDSIQEFPPYCEYLRSTRSSDYQYQWGQAICIP